MIKIDRFTPIKGFSLIELMIVVAIVAILAAVAYPAYTRHIQDTRETEAQAKILEFSGELEMYRAKNFSYAGATINNVMPSLQNDDFYNYVLALGANNQSYTITATPIGMMVGRANLVLDSTGIASWE